MSGGVHRLAAVFTVVSASMAIAALATPEASSSPCQALWVWDPAINQCSPPPPPPTPLWAPQDKSPVWDPGHKQWGIWIGPAWVPV